MEKWVVWGSTAVVVGLLVFLKVNTLRPATYPKHCKVLQEGYGIAPQLRFGKSLDIGSMVCGGGCRITANASNNFGPFYYGREVEGWASNSVDTRTPYKESQVRFRLRPYPWTDNPHPDDDPFEDLR